MSESKRTRSTPKLSDRAATVGRILLYTFTGDEHEHMCGRAICSERPAMVVNENGGGGTYNVQVFTDCRNDVEGGGPGADGTLWLTSLQIAEEATPGYLHWPEIVNAKGEGLKAVAPSLPAPDERTETAVPAEPQGEPAKPPTKPAKAKRSRKA